MHLTYSTTGIGTVTAVALAAASTADKLDTMSFLWRMYSQSHVRRGNSIANLAAKSAVHFVLQHIRYTRAKFAILNNDSTLPQIPNGLFDRLLQALEARVVCISLAVRHFVVISTIR